MKVTRLDDDDDDADEDLMTAEVPTDLISERDIVEIE
jgi:hypothetical protein